MFKEDPIVFLIVALVCCAVTAAVGWLRGDRLLWQVSAVAAGVLWSIMTAM